jgi:hypothetical protein
MVIASPNGGEAPLAIHSIELCPNEESQTFRREKQSLWNTTAKLSDFIGRANEFDAVYYPGCYGRKFHFFRHSFVGSS